MVKYDCCRLCEKHRPGCQNEKCKDWAETNKRVEAEKEKIQKNKHREAELEAVGCLRGERWRKGARSKADERRRKK